MVIIWYAGVFLLKGVVRAVAGGVGAGGDMPNWMTFLISDVPLYLIAMPVAVALMGKSTVIETRKFNMKPGMFFKLLLMCLPMMWVGSMVGSMLSLALSDGEATNRVADLAMQTNIWNVVFLVILGPIFEEWMFRKQLIDHTRKYGEKTAILLSGLAFGLFHMNLFQFFYAFLLGVMFGYIYMRTSKLRYSTAMHMIINFNGGVLAPWILTRVDLDQLDKVSQAAENGNVAAMEQWASQNATGLAIMLVYFLLYGAMVLVGFVLLIRNFRKAEFYTAPEELPRGVRVDMNGEDVSVDVSVTVDYGMPIQKVGRSAQENVRKSIESMTGLHVEKVDLHVVGVSFEKENEELQQSQKIALSLEAEEEQHALEEGKVAQETQAQEQERAEDEPTDEPAAEAADEPTEEDAGQEEESSEQA